MIDKTKFYINGKWVKPFKENNFDVINPSTEKKYAQISLGSKEDLDLAVSAAKDAFESWAFSDLNERISMVEDFISLYDKRSADMAEAISTEMGAPIKMATNDQVTAGSKHMKNFIAAMKNFKFEQPLRSDTPDEQMIYEPIGVCGLITPWNWPMNQVTLKVIPAILTGCTMILKPSEIAPMSSLLFAEMIDEIGFPPGIFNLVNGDGPTVGEAMSAHPDIDMMSFTGSTRAGIAVSKGSANTIKRVSLELGGKGANVIFSDSDVKSAVKRGSDRVLKNSGQSCNAPTRMLVEKSSYEEAVSYAKEIFNSTPVDSSDKQGDHIGPVVSRTQFDKIQDLIQSGIDEGAELVTGGTGRPEGLSQGYYVKPTVFANVNNEMRIAREEIFGPVLSIIPFQNEDEAVEIANDTNYGLTHYVQSGDKDRTQRIARRLRAGMVEVNGAGRAPGSPFGGSKQSGNGREGGIHGLLEFVELKAVSGWNVTS
ncbi:MAG: aldehyde dehydrogenase family protein [Dehalococcoidia bacterium]|nr:aldehyde dehydrogenase family protein [Dehalococcoidia bacterium]|tara:strand:+ start:480 stop:1925 length:1446 start_codon:yes stop_codon:yes gene_type:complete